MKGASVLASGELGPGSLASSTRSLEPCQESSLVSEWSSLSGERSASGAPGMEVAWAQNFPISLLAGAHPDPRYVNYIVETQSSLSWTRMFLWCWEALSLASASPPGPQALRWYLSQPCLSLLPGSQAGRAGGSERLFLSARHTPL